MICAAAAAWPAAGGATPANPAQKITLKQPGGGSIVVHPFGDEWYHGYETLGGFTVLRDRSSRTWEYAERGDGGGLTARSTAARTLAAPRPRRTS